MEFIIYLMGPKTKGISKEVFNRPIEAEKVYDAKKIFFKGLVEGTRYANLPITTILPFIRSRNKMDRRYSVLPEGFTMEEFFKEMETRKEEIVK